MPKVVVFRERLLPQTETFILEQAAALRRYEPVFCGLRPAVPSLRTEFSRLQLVQGSGKCAALLGKAYGYLPIPEWFIRRVRAEGPSLIHAHFALDGVTALPIADALKVPLFVTLHGHDVTKSDAYFSRSAEGRRFLKGRPRLFDRVEKFLCVSHSIRDAALRAGFPEEKLHVHYTGIDCDRFARNVAERDEKLVVFVGRLVEKKGCAYLLRAMQIVQEQLPGAHVEVIGGGPLRPQLEALAEELKIKATFRGVLDLEQVRLSMSRARVLCNPSVTASNGDSEGFGMVLAEAQAVGTPVVSSMHAAIPEAVSHGKSGLLCPERDTASIADALLAFLQNDWYWQRTSLRAARWVRQNFDLAKQTARLEDLFDAYSGSGKTLQRRNTRAQV